MPSSIVRLTIAAVALASNVAAYWFTFQPSRPLGPIPIFVLLSSLIIAVGGLLLGRELSHQTGRTDRLATAILQLASLLCFATIGIGTGHLADPDWWDFGVTRVYYFAALAPGVLLVAVSHLGSLIRTKLRDSSTQEA
jgi:hypothetical protein